ncbi:YihY/virulence factor BrkB family protein [Roseovarius sp. C7]|uniref:YihY/virulence factor BrkB family protein n=1 Tax=Roseovarius sp. C7 TaxID=3398643 RepID=UPI0039F7282E
MKILRPSNPGGFPLRAWGRSMGRVFGGIDRLNIGLISAGVAFYALLSLFPAIAAMVAIWGFAGDPSKLLSQFELAKQFMPEEAYLLVQEQVTSLIVADNTTLQWTTIISLSLSLWSAKNATAALIRGLNSIYREGHRTNPLKRYGVALGLTVMMIVAAIVAFALVIGLPVALAFLNLGIKVELFVSVAKWAILMGVVLLCIGLLYRYGPNRRGATVPWLSPGALFALATWAAGSFAFSTYLRNFGSFNEVYGSLGALVALLFWFYISAYVVMIGALINAELELETAADTTVGPPRPPGEREAYVSDNQVNENGIPRQAPPDPTEPETDPKTNSETAQKTEPKADPARG